MQTKMHDRCIQEETPVSNGDMKSVVEGLSPPFVGEIAIQHMQKHVLVSDAEIIEATRMLYSVGSLLESSGVVALVAVKAGKIGSISGKKALYR